MTAGSKCEWGRKRDYVFGKNGQNAFAYIIDAIREIDEAKPNPLEILAQSIKLDEKVIWLLKMVFGDTFSDCEPLCHRWHINERMKQQQTATKKKFCWPNEQICSAFSLSLSFSIWSHGEFSIIQLRFTHHVVLTVIYFYRDSIWWARIKCVCVCLSALSIRCGSVASPAREKSIFFREVITVKAKYEQYVRFHIKHQPPRSRHTIVFSSLASSDTQIQAIYASSYQESYSHFLLRIYMLVIYLKRQKWIKKRTKLS